MPPRAWLSLLPSCSVLTTLICRCIITMVMRQLVNGNVSLLPTAIERPGDDDEFCLSPALLSQPPTDDCQFSLLPAMLSPQSIPKNDLYLSPATAPQQPVGKFDGSLLPAITSPTHRTREVTYKGQKVSVPISPYRYKPLVDAARQFRLLIIHSPTNADEEPLIGSLQRYELDESPSYVALSYEWGDPSQCIEICVDGQQFQSLSISIWLYTN
jgi:hypothetical protein